MNLGAHVSVAGGLHLAFENARVCGANVIQIFSKNSTQWKAKPITEEDAKLFKEKQEETGLGPVLVHDSYLINLCAPDPVMLAKSRNAFQEELDRCEILGIPYLVTHPGSHLGQGEDEGLRRNAESLNELFKRTKGYKVKVLLETTAGQGTNIGWRFEHIRAIMDRVKYPERVAVCYDTCHTLAAGYDFRTKEGYERVFDEFDRVIGIEKLEAFHLNDSKRDLGARVDRHEHIGKGFLGLEPFRLLLNDKRFQKIPMVLETPMAVEMHADNLKVLRSLRASGITGGRG